MNNIMPLVSIVITSYNRAHWIGQAIQSALDQDYHNLEIIISDNNSTDNTDEVIKSFCSDSRIKYYKNETNIGMLANFQKASLELASGEYITYISSDDYLVNNKFISDSISKFCEYPNLNQVSAKMLIHNVKENTLVDNVCFTNCKNTFYKEIYVKGEEVFLKFPKVYSLCFGGYIFKRSHLNKITCFTECICGDILIILQLLLLGDISFNKENTYVQRVHENNFSNQNINSDYYITNLSHITIPAQFALTNSNIKFNLIEKWKKQMLFNYVRTAYITLGKQTNEELKYLMQYIQINFPDSHKSILSNFRYKLHAINRTFKFFYKR